MNTDEIISRAARLVIQWRLFWALGLLTVIGGLVNGIVWRLVGVPNLDAATTALSARVATVVEEWVVRPAGPILGIAVFLLGGLVFWFVAAAAEGGIIRATATIEVGQPATFRQAWADGRRLLVRFVAIDTVLFLPLFLLLLAIMLVSSAGFFGTVVLNLRRNAAVEGIFQGLGVTAAVVLPLVCLLLPMGLITYFLRLAAFREAALNDSATRQSIRNGWQVLRNNMAVAASLAVLLYAIRYLARMLLSIVTVVLTIPSMVVLVGPWLGFQKWGSGFTLLAAIAGLVATIVSAAGNAILFSYGSISWTLAYRSWLAKQPALNGRMD